VSDLGSRAPTHLDAVLGDRGWPDTENSVVRDFGVRASVINRRAILLVIVYDVADDPGRASSPVDESSNKDRHAVLGNRTHWVALAYP